MAVAGVNALTSGTNEPAWAEPGAYCVPTPSAEGVVIGPSWASGAMRRHTCAADVRFIVNKIAQARVGA